ncbi:alpha/beta-hydrolase [Stereum hirsutum FP-91666 SS1]|uniref:alpha/beta-hydrolase n=1 Tax=Stereum hirsutum (strain FP-91666) TaxID=721885 RepID=UPI000440A841|nr:alpha/beta-hydrolase [Stereum hirsutum FP-91666 SS1]EIM87679.1 alpha/beta-hydrolase [Stereum hirsutum FP-91666 SS1]
MFSTTYARAFLALVLWTGFTYALTISSPLGPVVDLSYAAYAGNATSPTGDANSSVVFFGGIPYAQAPLGNLRFRAPQPLNETATGNGTVVDARNFATPCIQQPAVLGVGSEDCLRLNVWKPANATESSNLPVVVYIYGGGLYAGTTQGFPMYDWVAENQGIVAVSVSYRLNVLGFLSGSAVGEAPDADFNAGLLDQRAALEWVQRNIGKFGGDKDQVTIDGESAGGASVVMQMVAYGGEKGAPFKRVVSQSIGYDPLIDPLSSRAETLFANFSIAVGCSNDTSNVSALACLREAPLESIVTGINAIGNGDIEAVVDGNFLPDLPSHLITSGRFSTVEYMGGHCTHDGRTFAGGKPSQFVTDQDIVALTFPRWPYVTNETLQEVFDFYPKVNATGSPFVTEYDRAWTIAGDVIFTCMDQLIADTLVSKGVENVFSFRWNTPNPVLLAASPYLGVMHTSDLYYLFDGTTSAANAGFTFTPFNTSEVLLSHEAIAYWTSFAATGSPSTLRSPGSTAWSPYLSSATDRLRMVLTVGNGNVTQSGLEQKTQFEVDRCAFWMQDGITAQTRV